ncbi:MAG: DUF1080 domain-containing protein [Planctomycetia bacterium]|nr:DUF1080 domain-containing protein [Planctomycetia bacterium]
MKVAIANKLLRLCTLVLLFGLFMPGVGKSEGDVPDGFTPLFNGQDLTGWIGVERDLSPYTFFGWSEQERADKLASWSEEFVKDWTVENGELVNNGNGPYATTAKSYKDFELRLEYKTVAQADSGIYLRMTPQVQIWDYTEEGGKWNIHADKGSGGLFNNQKNVSIPLEFADKPFGQWNSFRITLVGDVVNVWLNDKHVVKDTVMENYWDREKPLIEEGPIQLQTHGGEIRWRNIYIKELTPETVSPFRIGIIGTTTSHVPAAVEYFNKMGARGVARPQKVTAVYVGGMPDNPSSWDRREKYAAECAEAGITVYATIEELLENVDGVMLESVDGRPHLEQVRPVIAAKKPVFIDKPIAGALCDVLEIFRLAQENQVPLFSSSSLRYATSLQKMVQERPLGAIVGCAASSPAYLNEKHPDFYWYAVHGVETLFTVMGPDCVSVSRVKTDGADLATGVWNDGRVGTMRGMRQGSAPYSAMVFAEKGVQEAGGYEGYNLLFDQVAKFFETGIAPIDPRETIAMFAFMSACDESWAAGGKQIALADVLNRAREQKTLTATLTLTPDGKVSWNEDAIDITDIATKIDELAKDGTFVRMIVNNRAAAPAKTLQSVLQAIDKAYFAAYWY